MIDIFSVLGHRLAAFGKTPDTVEVVRRAAVENPWFLPQEIIRAVENAGYGAACAVSPVPFRHTPSGHTVCPVRNLFCKYWIKLYFCFVPPPFFGAAGPKNIPADGR